MEKRSKAIENAVPLAEPYQRKIGKVTFVVSSFGNPKGTDTAQRLILRMLEEQIAQEGGLHTRKYA